MNDYETLILNTGKSIAVLDIERSLVDEVSEVAKNKTLTEFINYLFSNHSDAKFIFRTACKVIQLKKQEI